MDATGKFFDLQVNGYGGIDFNKDGLAADELHAACRKLAEHAVAGILATIITDDLEAMQQRLARLVELRRQDPLAKTMIDGIHIEGPFINEQPGFVGAHPVAAVVPASVTSMQRLLEAAGGLTKIVTLAPERDADGRVTRMLADQDIVVAAGHSDAALDDLKLALDSGLTMFTHLGNACPLQMHRHDNIIQRVLSLADRLWISFIADGAHVPFPALANYLRCASLEHSVIVTDAISAAGLGPGTYPLGSQTVTIGNDLVPWAEDGTHFVGSATIMPRVAENLRDRLGLSDTDILRLTRTNPLTVIGKE